jgi:hypothetical protein
VWEKRKNYLSKGKKRAKVRIFVVVNHPFCHAGISQMLLVKTVLMKGALRSDFATKELQSIIDAHESYSPNP